MFDFPQVDQRADLAGKGHGQLPLGQLAVGGAFQAFEPALDHQHLQVSAGQVLLRQVGTAGHQALLEVVVGDDLEQLVELADAQALADIGLEQARLLGGGQAVGALEFDVLDRETAGVGRRGRRCGSGLFSGQVLEFLQAPALLFEQAVLAFADQVGVTGGGSSMNEV